MQQLCSSILRALWSLFFERSIPLSACFAMTRQACRPAQACTLVQSGPVGTIEVEYSTAHGSDGQFLGIHHCSEFESGCVWGTTWAAFLAISVDVLEVNVNGFNLKHEF